MSCDAGGLSVGWRSAFHDLLMRSNTSVQGDRDCAGTTAALMAPHSAAAGRPAVDGREERRGGGPRWWKCT